MSVNGRELLAGVVVPVVTTMDVDRNPDAQQMHGVLDALSAASITKIMIFGSNGEGPVLGEHQIGRFARSVSLQWRKRAPGGVLLVNVSGVSTADSLRRAEVIMDSEVGPDALLLSPPMYFRHSRRDIEEHYRAFAGFGIPIVAYNSPAYTGNDLDVDVARDLLEMDHVIGMKDSSRAEGRIPALVEIAAGRHDFGVNQGDESGLTQALEDGAVGITPGIANLAPRLAVALYRSWCNGEEDRAWEMQEKIRQLVGIHKIRPGIATTKAALSLRGVCQRHVSSPFVDYLPEDLQTLSDFLAPWDSELVGSSE